MGGTGAVAQPAPLDGPSLGAQALTPAQDLQAEGTTRSLHPSPPSSSTGQTAHSPSSTPPVGTESEADVLPPQGDVGSSAEGASSSDPEKDGRDHSLAEGSSFDEDEDDHEDVYRASFYDVFIRFASKTDLAMNIIGLVAAAAAGSSQPLMTIVFGDLTTAFLQYSYSLTEGPEAQAAASAKLKGDVGHDALLLVYIGIGMFGATYIYSAAWVYTGEEITRRIREAFLAATLRQDIAYFDKIGAGTITTRLQSDTHLIQEGISDKVPMSVMFVSTFVTGFVVAYIKSWKLALALTSIVPCIIIAGAVMNVFVSRFHQMELEYVAYGGSLAEEALSTVRTAKAFGAESRLVDLYNESNALTTKQGTKKAIVQGFGLGIFFFIIYSGYALAFYFGSKLIASGEINTGVVVNVIFSILIGAFSMAMLAPNAQAVSFAFASAGKIISTIDRVPQIDSASPEGLKPSSCEGVIELRNIDFRYPSRKNVQVLFNLSLVIPAGETTALVGASGSGKSTIVGLVERFYDPEAGQVFLDGHDIKDLNVTWLRSQIALVSQEPTLFASSIRDNILHGLINRSQHHADAEKKAELVIEAAKQANAHDFITQLPNGYETMVGERGFLLSGGQKQRIAIARAIVGNPKILLLDEATSALDTQSESLVQDALHKAAQGRTTITIAHRLSTIRDAENIVVMGKGEILEQGTHNGLVAKNGAYASLVSAQKIEGIRADGEPVEAIAETEQAQMEETLAAAKSRPEMPAGLDRTTSKKSIASLVLGRRADEEAGRKEHQMGTLKCLWRLMVINREYAFTLYLPSLICSIASGAVYPAFAIVMGKALGDFALCADASGGSCAEPGRSEMRTASDHNALYMFIIALLASIAIVIQTTFMMYAASVLLERLRRKVLRAFLRADCAFFDQDDVSSGSLTNSLADNAQKINGLVGVTLGTIVQSLATLVVGFTVALAYGWKLALVCIACTPLTLSAGFVRLKLVVLKDAKIKKAHDASAQRACEAAAAIRTVQSLTREVDCLDIYKEALVAPGLISRNAAFVSNIFYAVSQALSFGVIALGFWYGSTLLINGEYTSASFFTVLTAVVFGSIQAGNVFNFVPDISNFHNAASDMINMLDNVPEIDSESTEGEVLRKVTGNIRLEGVHFRYPTRPTVRVLRGLDLDIKAGQYVALVGPSGCGKSTTIQLLERFYDPQGGSVKIDGHDLRDLNLKAFRRHVALVSQEPTLYDGTIAWNLSLGAFEDADKVTMEDMRRACAQANILQFVESLPDEFETEVGGKGTQLSGGQKQRLAIARALIRNPKILLLDEATSALDSTSEKVVQQALDAAAKGRTTIAIAHRLSTISKADRIYCLKDGVVGESGTHNQLMALNGIYANLVRLQDLQPV
ncbi:putative Leptomycin B resistance protein pmd1 [Microstroma glucosiphilum]|uniref:Putative Leptomycin B resistance protein pmd1 n=1 Tax=Pseudomicrostroma glucosiphilum TaxID=1684307 RepID=A0A316UB10_9BASI|nr:putative Leptomycin B resistance protein pmd1 [Pseudomicrostroma glucosiphilum]PWN22410.1 putative Leptomycin B resistance protein pmd1 [Pseudomicrostroma glucosiphilum]